VLVICVIGELRVYMEVYGLEILLPSRKSF
jgi:hypothetical protein